MTLLAGCTGAAGGAQTPRSAAPSVAAHPASPDPEQRRLQKIGLQAADLPPQWKSGPYLDIMPEALVSSLMAQCMAIRDTTPNKVAEVKSEKYTDGALEVVSIAGRYRSESDLDEDFGTLRNPRLASCTESFIRKTLEIAGAKVESMSVKAAPALAGSPANLVGVIYTTIKVAYGDQKTVVRNRSSYIRGPLTEVQIEMTSHDAPIPEDLMTALIAKVAARAAAS